MEKDINLKDYLPDPHMTFSYEHDGVTDCWVIPVEMFRNIIKGDVDRSTIPDEVLNKILVDFLGYYGYNV